VKLTRPVLVTIGALLCGVSAGLLLIPAYDVEAVVVQLPASFVAALLAFMIALAWERDREEKAVIRAETSLADRRRTEVRRRLATIQEELKKNRESLVFIEERLPSSPQMHPQLLEAAWTASAPRLTELLADYELAADLGVAYGRIEELRWRLRVRTQRGFLSLDGMILVLVGELISEVDDLLTQIAKQMSDPDLQTYGLLHRASGSFTVKTTASIDAEVIRSADSNEHGEG
jgi:hypothetical protein